MLRSTKVVKVVPEWLTLQDHVFGQNRYEPLVEGGSYPHGGFKMVSQ